MGNPTTTPLYEQWHNGGFIVSEANGHRSRDKDTLTGAALVYAGTVLGMQLTGETATAAALGTNTGNGTFGAITVANGTPAGAYAVEFDDATHFVVSNPSGQEIGHGTTGVAFNSGGLGFTITAGATAFVPGDSFNVTVVVGASKYAPLNLSATDGSQNAAAILFNTTDVTATDKSATVVSRDCEVNASELLWPTGATAAQIAAATAQLTALGIISR